MFKLKELHKDAVTAAIAKAERYRFLHDPTASESICRDILQIDPENQAVLVMLILCLTDEFGSSGALHMNDVREFIPQLKDPYQRDYYSGIICERWAKAQLIRGSFAGSYGTGKAAYEWLLDAMNWYEKADTNHKSGNDEALLRWNACVRTIIKHRLEPHDDSHHPSTLLE